MMGELLLHHRPVVVVRRSDVGGGAQLAPGPLVFSAAAPPITVSLLTERVGHGVGPEETNLSVTAELPEGGRTLFRSITADHQYVKQLDHWISSIQDLHFLLLNVHC